MYSIEQLPIKELSILLSGSQTDSQCRIERPVLDAVAHIEASYVADLLLNVELQSPKLTREYVKQLHSGDVSWKSTKGEYVSLKENFEFELLEELGLIFFEYDWLRVNTIHRIGNFFDEHTDETLKSIVRFSCKLNDIISGGGELEQLKFGLKENTTHKIIPVGYCFKNIKIDTNNQHEVCVQTLEISSHEIRCLISDYYWKKTVDISCEKWDPENYYTLTLAFNDLIFLPNSAIFAYGEEDCFIKICTSMIQSSLANLPLAEYRRILYSANDFIASTFQTHTSFTTNSNSKDKTNNPSTFSRSPLSIEKILALYDGVSKQKIDDDLELISFGDRSNDYLLPSSAIFSAISHIIKNDLIMDYQGVTSRGCIDQLLAQSVSATTLRHYLINAGKKIKIDIRYNLYLMSRPDSFIAGIKNVIDTVKEKYHSQDSAFEKAKSNISHLLKDVAIKLAFANNKEDDLAILIIALAKSNAEGEKTNGILEIEIIELIIKHLSGEQLNKLSLLIIGKIHGNLAPYIIKPTLYLSFLLASTCEELNLTCVSETLIILKQNAVDQYKKYFKLSPSNGFGCLTCESFYDHLEWDVCNEKKLIDDFIALNPPKNIYVKELTSTKSSYYFCKKIKNYVQVLLSLYELSNADKRKIMRIVSDIIIGFGFRKDEITLSIFDQMSIDNEYDLWNKVTLSLNSFSDEVFGDIASGISDHAPLASIMELYSNTFGQERKNTVLKIIEDRSDWRLNKENLPSIEKAFTLALQQNKLAIAQAALDAAKEFLENSPYQANRMLDEHKNKWILFEYKYELIRIFYSEDDDNLKLSNIENVRPISGKLAAHHSTQAIHKESEAFCSYIVSV